MSSSSQTDGEAPLPAIVVASFEMRQGTRFDEHVHQTHHQLVWAEAGVLTVEIDDDSWVLSPSLALWVPAGTPHVTSASKPAHMRGVFVSPGAAEVSWDQPTTVAVPPLLAQLFLHLARDELGADQRVRVEAVVFDNLVPVSVTTVHVPLPTDDRALRVAERIVAEPADDRGLDEWGEIVGASARTLSRLFRRDTGLSFTDWRTQARIRAAIALLAAGAPVTSVAHQVGYGSPSSFVAAFHRLTGATPGRYFGC